ncbi:hypothetical protein M0805_000758 [Coniferiporia weirii]|nr:hypothetical protein M0805_000758 [Coniferiporia weirii]
MSTAAAQNPPSAQQNAPAVDSNQQIQQNAQTQGSDVAAAAAAVAAATQSSAAAQPLQPHIPLDDLLQRRRSGMIPPEPPRIGGRKRKSPSTADDNLQTSPQHPHAQPQHPPPHPQHHAQQQQQQQQQQMPPPPPPHAYPLPPPPGSVYPPPTMQYTYGHPTGQDYTSGGMMPPGGMMQGPPPPQQQDGSDQRGNPNRQLSTSKRAEQNRKAQRAFRERRDQHVKALESRSQLLDAALAGADEANRRWEECRALVDQLRIENTALRSALQQTQAQLAAAGINPNAPAGKQDDVKGDGAQQTRQENNGDAPKESTAAS